MNSPAAPQKENHSMGRNPTVMIIDEREQHRQELQAMLTPARLAVIAESGYGVEATHLVEETHPDLVLVAIEDPVARAIRTIEAVREIVPNTPIIGYASSTDFGLVRKAIQAGVRDLLAEPVKAGELLGAIELAMQNTDTSTEEPGPGLEAAVAKRAKASAGTVLTIFGAKGGIGKTTIATNIASSIANYTDNSVLIIDLDTRFGDVAIMLDIEPRMTVSQMAQKVNTLDRETFRDALVHHESGAYVLPAPKHPQEWRQVEAEDIKELVRFAARMFDYVILDTPGAFNDIVASALDVATQVLVITSVDMASVKDTSLILDLLEGESFPADRLMLTVNHANGANTIRATDIERVLHKTTFWEIPHDPQVSMATQLGKPVILARPRSRAGSSLIGLASKITGTEMKPPPSRGLLRWLLPSR
jgi:pilus assembly protein CpaE